MGERPTRPGSTLAPILDPDPQFVGAVFLPPPTKLLTMDANGGQRWAKLRGQRDTIESGQRDIIRGAQTTHVDHMQGFHRQKIIDRPNGSVERFGVKQFSGDPIAILDGVSLKARVSLVQANVNFEF